MPWLFYKEPASCFQCIRYTKCGHNGSGTNVHICGMYVLIASCAQASSTEDDSPIRPKETKAKVQPKSPDVVNPPAVSVQPAAAAEVTGNKGRVKSSKRPAVPSVPKSAKLWPDSPKDAGLLNLAVVLQIGS